MSLLRSPNNGLAVVGVRRIVVATLGFCLIPALVGAAAYGVVRVIGAEGVGRAFVQLIGWTTLIALSPLLSWPFWAVTGLCTALLMRRGWYGALVAVGIGALAGGFTGALIDQPILAALGAILATFHRFALALWRPMAF